jgi:hypothetical protein
VPVIQSGNQGGDKFQIVLDVSDYKPEDIKVNLRDRNLTIKAKREVKESGFYSVREIAHQYTLPEDVDVDNLVSHFDEHDGLLAIEAPRKGATAAAEPKKIPIQRGGDSGQHDEDKALGQGDVQGGPMQAPGTDQQQAENIASKQSA